ncbi:MAG: hypothetical protein WA064_02320 [Candidatus Moraniibacteriota bacterium]
MNSSIREVVLLDTLKTSDGEYVPPGTYPVTQICLRDGSRGVEKNLFYLDGFDGICIELVGLYVLRQAGKIDF